MEPVTPRDVAADSNGTSNTHDATFLLSDLDLISPDTFVTSFLLYELNAEKDGQRIVESLRQGLNHAAHQLPPLACRIHLDDDTKRPQRRMVPGSLALHVRRFEAEEHKSYRELAASSFSPYEFNRHLLIPEDVSASSHERPVCLAQLNIISGGLILSVTFNHIATDGVGRNLAMSCISQSAKAHAEGRPMPTFNFDYSRDWFSASPELLTVPRQQLLAQASNHTIMNRPLPTQGLPPVSPSPNQTPIIKGRFYRVEGSSCQQLKKICQPIDGIEYLSTYDCVVAQLWRSIMRARAALNPSLLDGQSRLLYPVDLRNRPGLGISKNYFGNAVHVTSAGPVSMKNLLGPDGLSVAASCIRRAIEGTNQSSITAVTALAATLSPTEQLLFRPSGGLLAQNFMLTSWFFMNTAAYDIGVGPPSAVRSWAVPVSGFAVLFPDCQRQPDARMYEFFVPLPIEEHEVLRQDDETQCWFHIIDG